MMDIMRIISNDGDWKRFVSQLSHLFLKSAICDRYYGLLYDDIGIVKVQMMVNH